MKYQEKLETLRKQFWARLFSITPTRGEAFKVADQIKEKIGVWSWYDMNEEQLNTAYGMTNHLKGYTTTIDSGTEFGEIKPGEVNSSSITL